MWFINSFNSKLTFYHYKLGYWSLTSSLPFLNHLKKGFKQVSVSQRERMQVKI